MIFSDEILMAFADGELDESSAQALEAAMVHDPALAQRVAQHRALRRRVFNAFAPILAQPAPPRLMPLRRATVVQLDAVRAKKYSPAPTLHGAPTRRHGWPWGSAGALAASVMVGLAVGHFGWPDGQGAGATVASASASGVLTAQGKLAAALSGQLASAGSAGAVQIGVSFVSKEGQYCRSFKMAESSLAGLACRSGATWQIPLMAQDGKPATQQYRTAASEMPAAVLDAIDQRIAGAGLDAKAEQQALTQGWQR